ncbi:MAG: NUDIX domain-containing protein [Phycisphaerales bacterium]
MTDSNAPTPAVTTFPLNGRFPAIEVVAMPAAPWTDAHEAAWQRRCAANPRLHDGAIWSALHADATRITACLDRYRRLTVQADTAIGDLGVRHVGVKGLMTATDAGGVERILFARRGTHTRAYGNMWEIAPAGGVDVVDGVPLSAQSIIATLVKEASEELGIDASSSAFAASPFLMVMDNSARSLVFMVHLPWPGPFDLSWQLPETWEYSESRWLTREQAERWLRGNPDEITPPAAAALTAFLSL